MKSKVYRIENDDGIGPYSVDETVDLIGDHKYSNGHPVPKKDKGIQRPQEPEERCGFLSMKQLKSWFSESEIVNLRDLGFFITELTGKITAIGEKQVLFIPLD